MPRLEFVAADSRLTIETRAKGLLAKLAHDLSIRASDLACEASFEEGSLELELKARVSGLKVDGVRRGGAVDRGVLSASDAAEIQRKIGAEVLKAADVVATVSCPAEPDLLEAGKRDVAATVAVAVGGGRADVKTRASVESDGGRIRARGRATVALSRLRIEPVKGPLNAFRVDDDVDVVYDLVFTTPASQ